MANKPPPRRIPTALHVIGGVSHSAYLAATKLHEEQMRYSSPILFATEKENLNITYLDDKPYVKCPFCGGRHIVQDDATCKSCGGDTLNGFVS